MKPRFKRINKLTANRAIYTILLIAAFLIAYTSGERLAYLCAFVLFVLPFCSYIVTIYMLRRLQVKQTIPEMIVKNQEGLIKIHLHNPSSVPCINAECLFFVNEHIMEVDESISCSLSPRQSTVQDIPFRVMFRGQYQLGVKLIKATDIMGLFRLSRTFKKTDKITVLPRIVEFPLPLNFDLIAEASSRVDIKDEDYSIISDVRPYLPMDSIKRVHWKLTAKRNEWLVKIFQSNALNCVTVILDNQRTLVPEKEMYHLEDQIVESALGLAWLSLGKGMPVEFYATDDAAYARAQNLAMFNAVYNLTGNMLFKEETELRPAHILSGILKDSASYINAVIFTARLDIEFMEKMMNAINKGNNVTLVYFASRRPNWECERIFKQMLELGLPCFRIDHEVTLNAA